MRNCRSSNQQAIRADILHSVYQDNLGFAKPEQHARQRRSRLSRWMVVGLVVASLFPLVVFYFIYSTGTDSAIPSSDIEYISVIQANGTWNNALPPLIADANAGVETWPVDAGWPKRLDSADDYQAMLKRPDMALADLFGLDVRTIVIDPGHGGDDPGAIGANGLKEKDITLEIARLLYDKLSDEDGVNVVLTRDSDVTLSLRHRVEYAAQLNADLLISIHLNTIPNSPMTIVETYYFGTPSDAQSLEVARLENHHSEYTMTDFDELITQLGDTLKQHESRKLASHIQRSVYGTLSIGNRRIIDAGIKSAPFVVLMGSGIPSVLAEVTCISNTTEEARLTRPSYRDTIAEALEKGVLSYLHQLREQQRKWPEQENITYAESQG